MTEPCEVPVCSSPSPSDPAVSSSVCERLLPAAHEPSSPWLPSQCERDSAAPAHERAANITIFLFFVFFIFNAFPTATNTKDNKFLSVQSQSITLRLQEIELLNHNVQRRFSQG